MTLTPLQLGRLHAAVLARFGAPPALDLFLQTTLGKRLATLAGGGGLDAVALTVIGRAEKEMWVGKLVSELYKAFPADPALEALHDELRQQWAVARLDDFDPYTSHRLAGRIPFLGRPDVRAIMRQLARSQAHACVVNGPEQSGKTITSHYIHHLRLAGGAFDVFVFRLQEWAGEPVPALAASIVRKLGFDPNDVPVEMDARVETTEQATRWCRVFGEWLVGAVGGRDRPFWLVFDDCADFAREDTRALLDRLVKVAGDELPEMRVVLLHFARVELPCSEDFLIGLEEETITVPDVDEVAAFFEHEYLRYNAEAGGPLADAELAPRIIGSVQAAFAAAEQDAAGGEPWLAALQKAVAAEAEALRETPLSS